MRHNVFNSTAMCPPMTDHPIYQIRLTPWNEVSSKDVVPHQGLHRAVIGFWKAARALLKPLPNFQTASIKVHTIPRRQPISPFPIPQPHRSHLCYS